ncbi:alpha-1,2-Mannosidase [Pleurostoma richardsiae]|uniref:alpha-1,2-Mannosidase n=1 Tax=Pleurostoma richardsiae TaxID=41990 RepID=A0AA38VIN3_9PEZI|nr:alpha-1,2-Mannosidase [Pleurostoma richardsiae]
MYCRLRGMHALVYACCMTAFYLLLSPVWTPQSSEFARLEKFMNHDATARTWKTRNSFNWSSVHFHSEPDDVIPLPQKKSSHLPRIQHTVPLESAANAIRRESRRQEVRAVFMRGWYSYRKYAWMRDALLPISGAGGKDQLSGWAATLVDSLDTLWIMGLKQEFDEAVNAVAWIDFGRSSTASVNMFETNIRYLGGLLAAYDLSGRRILLEKAIELGDLLYTGFNTDSRMPVDFIDFERARAGQVLTVESRVVSASPGTLSLEFTRLSQLSGDPKYYTAVSRVMQLFYSHQNETNLPGMWPVYVSMSTRDVVSGSQFTLAGCADSLYEYLPKMHLLLHGRDRKYKEMSISFMDAADQHLLFRPMLPGGEDILVAGHVSALDSNIVLDPESEHLACFTGGIYALGGRLFGRPNYVATGSRLARGCAYGYRAFPMGILPERYSMVACRSRQECSWDEEAWVKARQSRPEWKEHLPLGFTTAKDPRYILRPEAAESLFVLYRITGLLDFQEAAWEMFQAVNNGTATQYANAAVSDVTKPQGPPELEDYMESFWLAETLKYFYLIFSPLEFLSLDDYVFNTEAHPFRIPK